MGYNNRMKENKEKNTPKAEALSTSPYATARANLKKYLESGKSVRQGTMQVTTTPEELPPLVRRREGLNGPFEDRVTLKMASLVPCPMQKRSERERVEAEDGEKEAAREGRPQDRRMPKTTSSAPRLRCSRCGAIFVATTTLKAPTSVSHVSNG